MLVEGKYVCSPYEMFIKNDAGKENIQSSILSWQNTTACYNASCRTNMEKTLINDTFQAIKGKGVHKCKKKVEYVVQKLKYKYCLQIDVKKFYPSINNRLLKRDNTKKDKM